MDRQRASMGGAVGTAAAVAAVCCVRCSAAAWAAAARRREAREKARAAAREAVLRADHEALAGLMTTIRQLQWEIDATHAREAELERQIEERIRSVQRLRAERDRRQAQLAEQQRGGSAGAWPQ
eukprot:TRINITY_DN71369_c0_g1_i1.p3 TRINITY_DN71369_c0_g1~~TRINITY_DN71369_c0_g1_i1.p3  ORF type:complete len:124 (+),score=34.44 TRINITY_DN71369_c0_g1_i1:84-455(+)